MNEKTKREVYDYIKSHSHVSVQKIVQGTHIEEIEVLDAVNELMRGSFITMDPPEPLSETNDCSCYYTATGKQYN